MKEYGLEAMWAAFAYGIVQDIIIADERLTRGEVGILRDLEESMKKAGLMRGDGTLDRGFDSAREQAEQRLAAELPLDDKLRLLTLFHKVCRVDGEVDTREGVEMKEASEILGLTADQYREHLAGLYLT